MKTHKKTCVSYWRECPCRVKTAVAPVQGKILHDRQGFTLLELIIVCAVIGVLVTMAVPVYNDLTNLAKSSRAAEEIRSIEKVIMAYQADRGVLPPNLIAVGQDKIKDPWGNGYWYEIIVNRPPPAYTPYAFPFGDQNTDFDLYSTGADGLSGKTLAIVPQDPTSRDDIVRASDGAWVGRGATLTY